MSTLPNEWHTSDLMAICARQVQLRLEGREYGETGKALYRGNLGHGAMEWLYTTDKWDDLEEAVRVGVREADKHAEADNKPLSGATKRDRDMIAAEVMVMLRGYVDANLQPWADDEILGTEIPCRIELGGETFASHLDLAFRRDGELHIRDFKFGDKVPPLTRSFQMGLYWLMAKRGRVRLGKDEYAFWDSWDQWPRVFWLHMRDLRPSARGDKPLRECEFDPEAADTLEAELLHKVRAFRQGHWPMTVGDHCWYCDSWKACPQWRVES